MKLLVIAIQIYEYLQSMEIFLPLASVEAQLIPAELMMSEGVWKEVSGEVVAEPHRLELEGYDRDGIEVIGRARSCA